MGLIILILLLIVAMGSYSIHHHNRWEKMSHEEVFSLYEKYRKEGLDIEYSFPVLEKGYSYYELKKISLKKSKVYKLNFFKDIDLKNSLDIDLCNNHKEPLSKDEYFVYPYNTKFFFLVVKKDFCGYIYLYDQTPKV